MLRNFNRLLLYLIKYVLAMESILANFFIQTIIMSRIIFGALEGNFPRAIDQLRHLSLSSSSLSFLFAITPSRKFSDRRYSTACGMKIKSKKRKKKETLRATFTAATEQLTEYN